MAAAQPAAFEEAERTGKQGDDVRQTVGVDFRNRRDDVLAGEANADPCRPITGPNVLPINPIAGR